MSASREPSTGPESLDRAFYHLFELARSTMAFRMHIEEFYTGYHKPPSECVSEEVLDHPDPFPQEVLAFASELHRHLVHLRNRFELNPPLLEAFDKLNEETREILAKFKLEWWTLAHLSLMQRIRDEDNGRESIMGAAAPELIVDSPFGPRKWSRTEEAIISLRDRIEEPFKTSFRVACLLSFSRYPHWHRNNEIALSMQDDFEIVGTAVANHFEAYSRYPILNEIMPQRLFEFDSLRFRYGRKEFDQVEMHIHNMFDAEFQSSSRSSDAERAQEGRTIHQPELSTDWTASTLMQQKKAYPISHSADFRSIMWYGKQYTFSRNEALSLEVLWNAFLNDTPEVGTEALVAHLQGGSKTVKDVFKGNDAWGILIVPGTTKGSYRLAIPTTV